MRRLRAGLLIIFAVISGIHAMVNRPDLDAERGYDAGTAILSRCKALQLRQRPSSDCRSHRVPEDIVICLRLSEIFPTAGWFEAESASSGSRQHLLLGYVDGQSLYAGYFAMGMAMDPMGSTWFLTLEGIKEKLRGKMREVQGGRIVIDPNDFWNALPEDLTKRGRVAFNSGCIGISRTLCGKTSENHFLTKDCFLDEKTAHREFDEKKCPHGECPRLVAIRFPLPEEIKEAIKVDKSGRIESSLTTFKRGRTAYKRSKNKGGLFNYDFGFMIRDADRQAWYIHANQGEPGMEVYVSPAKTFNQGLRDFNTTFYCIQCEKKGKGRTRDDE